MGAIQSQDLGPEDKTVGGLSAPDSKEAIEAQFKQVYHELHAKGVDFLIFEGMGYQYFLENVAMTGEIVGNKVEKVTSPDGVEVEFTTLTLKGDSFSRDFEIKDKLTIEEGQSATINGIASYFINGAIDFINGVSDEQCAERLRALTDLLNDKLPALALSITVQANQIYEDREAAEQARALRAGEVGFRDYWKELLAEFEEQPIQ